MRTLAIAALVCCFPLNGVAFSSEPSNQDSEGKRFIAQFESQDFEQREKAAKALESQAEKYWKELKASAETSESLEARHLAKRVMAAYSHKVLAELLDRETQVLKNAEKEHATIQVAYNHAMSKMEGTDENSLEVRAFRNARSAYAKSSLEISLLRTRVLQMKDQLAQDTITVLFAPETPRAWNPFVLPFQQRLQLRISLVSEVGLSQLQLVEFVKKAAGIPVSTQVDRQAEAQVMAPVVVAETTEVPIHEAMGKLFSTPQFSWKVDSQATQISVTAQKNDYLFARGRTSASRHGGAATWPVTPKIRREKGRHALGESSTFMFK